MSERTCPCCEQEMTSARFGPLSLELCLPCGGVWLDYGELPQLVRAGAVPFRKLADRVPPGTRKLVTRRERSERCPVCTVPLLYTEYPSMPGVALQTCPFCEGFWIESDALRRIAERLERAAPAPKPAVLPYAAPVAVSTGPVVTPWAGAPPPVSEAPHSPKSGKPVTPPASEAAARPVAGPQDGDACPACGQRNAKDAPVCWACGHLLKGRVAGTCPRCLGSMHEVESGNVRIAACDGCGGVWLERGRIGALLLQDVDTQDRLLQAIRKLRSGRIKKLQQGLVCQGCKLVMFAIPQGILSSKPIDTCPGCTAQFLDFGVLDQMLHARR
ncbi:MAG TPA: zf-TFIIB domain-containing protein [Armatimonadota bacterium]|nr:zf-TFIIB domain-containing protein [Armatimonadota bacterium]